MSKFCKKKDSFWSPKRTETIVVLILRIVLTLLRPFLASLA